MASCIRCSMSSSLLASRVPRRTDPIMVKSRQWGPAHTLSSFFFRARLYPCDLSSAASFGSSKKFHIPFRGLRMGGVVLAQLEERPLEGFEVTSEATVVESASSRELESKGSPVEDVGLEGGGGGGLEGGFGSGGGGDDGSNGNNSGGENEEGKGNEGKKKMLLMSQKLTLVYAALVGAGGVMGFIKGGSQKSLAAGGLSTLLLFYVYLQLPSHPVFASSLGLGVSAALLTVMGSRFKKSGKIFPAGVVSLVSLIMTGGYFHGIMRTLHT